MALDSDKKLTKFESGETVVTSDFANSVYGGLKGTFEADSLSPDDPRVVGHIHDGVSADGHAGKINLVSHVEDQLLNVNLADNAVTKRNVRETIYQEEAVPEYDLVSGVKKYYLDLRQTKSEFTFIEDDSPSSAASGITESNSIRQRSQEFDGTSYSDIPDVWSTASGRDFVFGSSSLEDIDSGTDGDNRFFFDKSSAAFRAGSVSSTEWDIASRGDYSVSFGRNNISAGEGSVSLGKQNSVMAGESSILGGLDNSINLYSINSVISGGQQNILEDSAGSVISGGQNNSIYDGSDFSYIGGGLQNAIGVSSASSPIQAAVIAGGQYNSITQSSGTSFIGGGSRNLIEGSSLDSGILSGNESEISSSSYSIISGGSYSQVQNSQYSFIGSGGGPAGTGDRNRISSSNNSAIISGAKNLIEGSIRSTISGGADNQINSGSGSSFLGGGEINRISSSTNSFVGSGSNNRIFNASPYSGIVSGQDCLIDLGAGWSFIGSGQINEVRGSASHSAILSGQTQVITNSFGSTILSGKGNSILGMGAAAGFNAIVSGDNNLTSEADYSVVLSGLGGSITQNSSYSMIGSGFQNAITLTDNSAILSGRNNIVNNSGLSAITSGAENKVDASSFDSMPKPSLAEASGAKAWSYMFGQKTRSGGGFNSEADPNLSLHPPARMFLNGESPMTGNVPGVWNVFCPDRGSSQIFVQTMSGRFGYNLNAILPLTDEISVATLDGGLAGIAPNRGFIPKANSAYAIKILGVISCSIHNASPSRRISIPFQFSCGVSTQPDGVIDYGTNTSTLVKIHDSFSAYGLGSVQLDLPATTAVAGTQDFSLFFTHNTAVPNNSGSSVAPGSELYFVLINHSFSGGTTSGTILHGESVSLRLEVTEINLSVYNDGTPP
jgi:hypothetical protein